MNWLIKMSQVAESAEPHNNPLWPRGKKGLLSIFGWQDFVVVAVIGWNEIQELSDKYPTEDILKSEGWVPCISLDVYGELHAKKPHYAPGTVHTVNPSNLYVSLADLIKRESRVLYPDLLTPKLLEKQHLQEFMQDYPELKGFSDFSEVISYESHNFNSPHGYTIQVHTSPNAHIGIGQTRPQSPYYWYIPELQKRSLDFLLSDIGSKELGPLIKSIWSKSGGFRYGTVEEARESAEKFLDYIFGAGL
jgi:hypothetical protein